MSSFPFEEKIFGAIFFDSSNGWALTGDASRKLYHLKNGVWQVDLTPTNIQFFELFGYYAQGPWFGCFDKIRYRYCIRHLVNDKPIDYYTPNADPILQMDYLGPNNIWAVCQWGQIMHFDGSKWELVPCPIFGHVTNISMANDSCGWAGGKYRDIGFLLHWDGKNWGIKMQFKRDAIPSVVMVNDTLGWGFLNDNPQVIRLVRDQSNLVDFTTLIQDTLVVNWQDIIRPTFFHNNGIVKGGSAGTAIVSYPNRQRDILWFTKPPENPQTKIYLLTHDGKISYIHQQSTPSPRQLWQYVSSPMQGTSDEYGVAFGDLDGDGDDDVYSINTFDKNHVFLYRGNRQIKNIHGNFFIDGAEHLDLLEPARSKEGPVIFDMGVAIADMDNDGDRDIYLTSMYEKNMLYENRENQSFREVAIKAGVSGGIVRSQVGTWGDIDNDGDVDLFVTNEDTTNMLFLNNGFGKFREITHLAGLTSRRGGKSATLGDLDGDGDLDLVVTFFNLPNRVYRNDGIDLRTHLPFYRDVTNLWLPPGPDSLAKSTAACLADIDNDGDLDLYICKLVSSNRLYENDGMGHFTDITEAAGLLDSCLTSSACFFDADNDGDLDLFLSNRGPNIFFKNLGNKKFIKDEKTFKLESARYSNGVACGDPDNDGDLDLYVANNDAESIYYENKLNNKNYLEIKLIGTKSNRDAIGAKAFLYASGHLDQKEYLLGMREINGGYGYGCMNSTTIHFGVQSDQTYDLKIWFPSGIEIFKTNVEPGQILFIEEQAGWAKSLALLQRSVMRIVKSQRVQIEFFKFIALVALFIAAALIFDRKKWIALRHPMLLPGYPLGLYLILVFVTKDANIWFASIVPVLLAIFSFGGLAYIQKMQVAHTTKERLAEELLVACKAFDHGSWATSCLNQLQLFAVNLPPNQPISEKIEQQLKETILSYYQLAFKELGHIHQLAQSAGIQVQAAAELDRQRLALSSNLEKIKVILALKKSISRDLLKNVYHLIEQIKLNLREVYRSAIRWFTCDAVKFIHGTFAALDHNPAAVIRFSNGNVQQEEAWVCIKPNEFAMIMDNLVQNAQRAMIGQPNPKISVKLHQNDRHLFIEFSDNGCGIPRRLWDTIFEEGYSTKNDSNGGFGLYYARKTLEKYGGSIDVIKSAPNRGTTFLLKLRRA
ncbi:MAG: FG-GAP-like repeat-containing protein [candidate division KSB1 bacterium]|nr:FG-GAP-like repeat-containing protein [candidate division KSB1 bacterium]MDZ7357737.1 FG-GAP-like repeat-containing protein [candidate division KSB1 bacterium]MDZ7399866.1 FG-GAP-like repeat-containing protein [candidate division KSB1 bacterium]